MQQLLDSDLEVVVAGNFLFVPLWFDPSIAAEIQARKNSTSRQAARGSPDGDGLLTVNGQYFIKSLSLDSLLAHFENLHPDVFNRLRDNFLEKNLGFILNQDEISLDNQLATIIFQILPYFLARGDRLAGKKRPTEENILDFIGEKIFIPGKYKQRLRRGYDPEISRKLMGYLDSLDVRVAPLREGRMAAADLKRWFYQAVSGRIVAREKARLEQKIVQGEHLSQQQRQHAAVLLYLAEKGALEIEGFGFWRLGKGPDYVIYQRTGEYALKDFYGRPYLFPDCRVAISTAGRLRPVVLERYKHPFLHRFAARQVICLRHFTPPQAFTAAGAISALEEGINALFYGYNCRRRNGYHSLDRLPREERLVDFEDYRLTPEHPKIASGQVDIKNAYA